MSGAAGTSLHAERLVGVGGRLLEGPTWDARTRRLRFVDITAQRVYSMRWGTRRLDNVELAAPVTAAVPRRAGGVVVATNYGLSILEGARARPVLSLGTPPPGVRTNDAGCDPAGRLWVGTMHERATEPGGPRTGQLFRVTSNWSARSELDTVGISNGMAWSSEGHLMYYVDSVTRRIDVFDFDVSAGSIAKRRVFADLGDEAGLPDGMCLDQTGGVWVAMFGAGRVLGLTPDGRVSTIVSLDASLVTSCCFAGPELSTLVITTADEHDSGADLYSVALGVRGRPSTKFAG